MQYKIVLLYKDIEHVEKRDSLILSFKPSKEQLRNIRRIAMADSVEVEEVN